MDLQVLIPAAAVVVWTAHPSRFGSAPLLRPRLGGVVTTGRDEVGLLPSRRAHQMRQGKVVSRRGVGEEGTTGDTACDRDRRGLVCVWLVLSVILDRGGFQFCGNFVYRSSAFGFAALSGSDESFRVANSVLNLKKRHSKTNRSYPAEADTNR